MLRLKRAPVLNKLPFLELERFGPGPKAGQLRINDRTAERRTMSSSLPLRAATRALLATVALLPLAQAQTNGTWNAASGNWIGGANWADGAIANGIGAVATFAPSTTNITVTNDLTDLVLGGISIGTTATHTTTISGGSILLRNGTESVPTTPVIHLGSTGFSANLSLNSTLTGTHGFTLTSTNNNPRLTIGGTNTSLSGTVTINSATLALNNDSALGSANVVLNGGNFTGNNGRTINNAVTWAAGSFSQDTGSNDSGATSTITFSGPVTLNAASGNLVNSAPNRTVSNVVRFTGVLSGGTAGNTFTLNNGNEQGNVFTAFTNANTFAHNITVNHSGGGSPASGLGKSGSMGIVVGNDAALSAATVTIAAGTHRFSLASTDSAARSLANNFVWQTNNATSGNAPAYLFNFGAYNPVTPTYTTVQNVGNNVTLGGTGDVAIGALTINANTGAVAATHRRLNVSGATVATVNGVLSRTGTLAAASLVLEKTGSGTLVLTNAGNTYDGVFNVAGGRLVVDGALPASTVTVGPGAAIGGNGTITHSLAFDSGAKFVFDPAATLKAGSLSFTNFSVGDLLGFGPEVADGVYTLLQRTNNNSISSTGLQNLGAANAYELGGGRSAYFLTNGSQLDLVVAIPEPAAFGAMAGFGALGLAALRRRRR